MPTGGADPISGIRMGIANAFPSQSVDIGGRYGRVSIASQTGAHILYRDPEDVIPLLGKNGTA